VPAQSAVAADPVPAASAAPPAARRLPLVDLEMPPAGDPETEKLWDSTSKALAADDFGAADRALAQFLAKQPDPPTKEILRLSRALLWVAHGRAAAVTSVLEDLVANGSVPEVRERAQKALAQR
jgi:hypothetical protein